MSKEPTWRVTNCVERVRCRSTASIHYAAYSCTTPTGCGRSYPPAGRETPHSRLMDALIQGDVYGLPRILVPRTWVNKSLSTSKHPVATVSSHKYHPFRVCIDAHNLLPYPCGRRC